MKRLLIIISALALTYQAHAMCPRMDAIEHNTPANCKPINERTYSERHSNRWEKLGTAKAVYQALLPTCKMFSDQPKCIKALIDLINQIESTFKQFDPEYKPVSIPEKKNVHAQNSVYRRSANNSLYFVLYSITAIIEDMGDEETKKQFETVAQQAIVLINKFEASFESKPNQPKRKRKRDDDNKENAPRNLITSYFAAPPIS